jgi:hypothetical protein
MAGTTIWARTYPAGAGPLRRGAWYPAIQEGNGEDNEVLVDVGARRIAIHTQMVELRPTIPSGFSVVERSPADPNPARGTPDDLGHVYAVCPVSRTRVRLGTNDDVLTCPDCGYEGVVTWGQRC